jgi:hypothetical protein
MLGGPGDGDTFVPNVLREHGRKFEIVVHLPLPFGSAVPANEPIKIDRNIYRIVSFRCGDKEAFAAIPDHQPDSFALVRLFTRASA